MGLYLLVFLVSLLTIPAYVFGVSVGWAIVWSFVMSWAFKELLKNFQKKLQYLFQEDSEIISIEARRYLFFTTIKLVIISSLSWVILYQFKDYQPLYTGLYSDSYFCPNFLELFYTNDIWEAAGCGFIQKALVISNVLFYGMMIFLFLYSRTIFDFLRHIYFRTLKENAQNSTDLISISYSG